MDSSKSSESMIYVVETPIGVLGVTQDQVIIDKALYPRDPEKIAAALEKQASGEVSKEMGELAERLTQRGYEKFIVASDHLADALRNLGHEVDIAADPNIDRRIRSNIEGLAVDLGFVESAPEFYEVSREVSVAAARRAVRSAQSERSAAITQTVQLLNELDKTLNVLSSKLREWYGLHFPELSRLVDSHRTYAEIVHRIGDRSGITHSSVEGMDLGPRAARIVKTAGGSMGAALLPEDSEKLQGLAERLLGLYGYRAGLEDHISSIAEAAAPNLSVVAGPVLAAKLIEKAGSIRRLAMMPSGTVQLLGAEKALFRAKKTRARPPKHGLIFQHPYVHSKPRKLRGRAARKLASKLSFAARADAFSGNPIGAELRRQLDEEQGENR